MNYTKRSVFNKYLRYALVLSNIPLNKLNNDHFESFLEKYTSKEIPNQTTVRKDLVNDMHADICVKISSFIFDKKIWAPTDNIMDSKGRYVANVIVKMLKLIVLVACYY